MDLDIEMDEAAEMAHGGIVHDIPLGDDILVRQLVIVQHRLSLLSGSNDIDSKIFCLVSLLPQRSLFVLLEKCQDTLSQRWRNDRLCH